MLKLCRLLISPAVLVIPVLSACAGAPAAPAAAPGATSSNVVEAATTATDVEAPTSATDVEEGEPYKIGVVADQTGGNTALGVPAYNTVMLYADQVNAAGGIRGPDGKQHRVDVVALDAASDEAKAGEAVERLIAQQVVGIVGPTSSGAALAAIPVANPAQVPMLAVAASTRVVEPVAERRFIFQAAQNERSIVAATVRDLQARNYTRVAVLHADTAFGQNGLAEFQRAAPSAGITLVYTGAYAPDATDMSAELRAAQAANPDVLVNWGVVSQAATLSKNRVALGITTPLYHSAAVGNVFFLQEAGAAAEGVRLASAKILVADELPDDDPAKPLLLRFIADYQARYGSVPGTFASNAYDGFFLLLHALERAGPDRIKIQAALEQITEFVGTSGSYTYSPDNHSGPDERAMVMVEVKGGKWTLAP